MNKNKRIRRIGLLGFTAVLVISGLFFSAKPALADETGNFCVEDYITGVCTANDSGIEELSIFNLIESCADGTPGYLTADFLIMVHTAIPNRYDYGFYIALDGDNAGTGDNCYHGYYAPPVVVNPTYGDFNGDSIPDLCEISTSPPFLGWDNLDGDACGDILGGGTQAIRYIENLTIKCVDNSGDGIIDVSACAGWDNLKAKVCNDVKGAIPNTPAKCRCDYVNLYTPTGVALYTLDASSTSSSGWLIPTIAAALFVVSTGIILLVKKLTPRQK